MQLDVFIAVIKALQPLTSADRHSVVDAAMMFLGESSRPKRSPRLRAPKAREAQQELLNE